MGIRHDRAIALAVVAMCVGACAFDSSGMGSGGASIGEGDDDGTTGTATTGPTTSTSATTTTAVDTSGSSGEGGCPVGTQGCPCDGDSCLRGLVCSAGECVPSTCGNGTVEDPEDCDDQNDIPDDGCEVDCTVSPGAAQIAAGSDHTCARTFDGRTHCWGEGDSGRTAQGSEDDIGDDEPANAGVGVMLPSAAKFVALGDGFSCARMKNDEVACWGSNANGRLGLGMTPMIQPAVGDEPTDMITAVSLGVTTVDLAVGAAHACAVLSGGTVKCWGAGGKGRLGYGLETGISGNDVGDEETPGDLDPVAVGGQASAIAAGDEHTCALVGIDVRCWGAASEGRLGTLEALEDIGDDEDPDSLGPLVFGPDHASAIACGGHHSCAIVGDVHELWCWGNGGNGRLGTGNTFDAPEPVRVDVGGRVTAIDLGEAHTCVLLDDVMTDMGRRDGVVRCFGMGMTGRLGYASEDDLGGAPDTIPSLLPIVEIVDLPGYVLGITAGTAHTCARISGGAVRCWGDGGSGRLGYGDLDDIGDDETPLSKGNVPS